MPGIQQLCGSFGEIQVGSIEPCAEGMKVEGAVSVKSMYTTTDTEIPFYCIRGNIPFSYMLEMPAADSDCLCEVEPSLEQLSVTMLDNNEVEARASLSFAGLCCRVYEEDMITDVKVSELDPEKVANLPGIVAYIVKEGDTLWTIGKKYYVPVARMREMNDLGDREIRAGDKLLVVKGY